LIDMQIDLNNPITADAVSAVFGNFGISERVNNESLLNACFEHGKGFADEVIKNIQSSKVAAIEGDSKKDDEPVVYPRIYGLPQPIFYMAVGAIISLIIVAIKK